MTPEEENQDEECLNAEKEKLSQTYYEHKKKAYQLGKEEDTKENKINFATALSDLGEIELQLGLYRDSIVTYEKAYKLFNEAQIANEQYFATLYYLSSAYYYEKDLHNAIDCLECYIKVAKKVDHPQDSNMLTVMDDLASYYEAKDGNNKNSLPLREKVAAMMRMSSKSGILPDISFDS